MAFKKAVEIVSRIHLNPMKICSNEIILPMKSEKKKCFHVLTSRKFTM